MNIPPLPPRFINWRLIGDKKVPCRPDGSSKDYNPHDQTNHLTYEQASASQHSVGYAMVAEDGWFFLDLDKCHDGTNWNPQAAAIYQSFNGAWGEVSTSGRGLHILGRCDPTQLQDRRNKWDGWLEFYTDKRFIAFGPHGWSPIGGAATGVDWTQQLISMVPQREFLGDLPDGRDASYTGPDDDDALIAMMLRSSGGAASQFGGGVTVKQLWEADPIALGAKYPSYDGKGPFDHSSADAALMSHLAFWTGKDMPRMDRLFRRSALMRDKFEKRADYRRDTVQNAARLCKKVYDKPARTLPGLPAAGATGGGASATHHEAFLSVSEMIEHFKGCVYVRDIHKVLVPDGSLLKPEQFNATYGGHLFQMMADGTKPTKRAFEALTECMCHSFPQAKRTCFRPDLSAGTITDDDEVNVYVKPNVTVTAGDVTPFTDFLARLIPDERDRTILMSWCAAVVQYQGVRMQWSPVLQGTEGNGKSLIARCMRYVLGEQYCHEPKASQMQSQFMSFDENKLLITVEEFHMNNRRQALDDLKTRITNEWIEVEAKGQDKRMIRNTASWLFCTNYKDAVIKSRNDRRYSIFFTAQQSEEDLRRDGMSNGFFPALYEWLRGGGYAAVAHHLSTWPIPDEFNPAGACQRAPKTSSTEEAVRVSIGGIEADVIEAIESDTVGFRGGWVSTWALEQLLRKRGHRVSRPKMGEIMRNVGYQQAGRSSRAIIREDGQRPMLWSTTGGGTVDDYVKAQGVGYT